MPAGNWSQMAIAGRPCDCYEPPRPSEHGFTVVYLHGIHLARLTGNEAFCREFDRYGLRVLAPQTGRCWWADRPCPDFVSAHTPFQLVARDVVAAIEERWGTHPPAIALLGTSMGGQGALRLAFRQPNTFPVVAAISPAIDFQWRYDDPRDEYKPLRAMYDDAEAARQDSATLHVHPLNWPRNIWLACDPADDPWHESTSKLRMKLAALGIPHEHDLETTGGGHGFEYYDRMAPAAIKFLAERLEHERLRV
ncbi:MAG: alpha/beta hydrolase [Pirellulales bacterium]